MSKSLAEILTEDINPDEPLAEGFSESVEENEDRRKEDEESAEGHEARSGESSDEMDEEEEEQGREAVEEEEQDETLSVGSTSVNFNSKELSKEGRTKLRDFVHEIANEQAALTSATNRKSKELLEREKAIAALSNLSEEVLTTYTRGASMRNALNSIEERLTPQLWEQSPDEARRLSDEHHKMNFYLNQIVGELQDKESKRTAVISEERTRRKEAGEAELNKLYPNFSTKIAPKMVDYAVSKGVQREDADLWGLDPIIADMVYKSMLWENLQKSRKIAKKTKVSKPAKPSVRRKSISDMSDAEFRKLFKI